MNQTTRDYIFTSKTLHSSMKLRPHHILDILRTFGNGIEIRPHPYGHNLHKVAEIILNNLETEITLVNSADEICIPCKHLGKDGLCLDVLAQLDTSPSKQKYNDQLDAELFTYFKLKEGSVITLREYLNLIKKDIPRLTGISTHPKEDPEFRASGLRNAINKLEEK